MEKNRKTPIQPEEEARRAFDLLDQIGRVEGDPWLFTRIQARLGARQFPEAAGRVLPAWQWAMVFLALAASSLFFSKNIRREQGAAVLSSALVAEFELNQSYAADDLLRLNE